jgi:F0F1-type ATP synthase gamma subunit
MRESAGNIGAMDTATKNYNDRLKELENEINKV